MFSSVFFNGIHCNFPTVELRFYSVQAKIYSPSLQGLMSRAQQGDKNAYAAVFKTIPPVSKVSVDHRLGNTAETNLCPLAHIM